MPTELEKMTAERDGAIRMMTKWIEDCCRLAKELVLVKKERDQLKKEKQDNCNHSWHETEGGGQACFHCYKEVIEE